MKDALPESKTRRVTGTAATIDSCPTGAEAEPSDSTVSVTGAAVRLRTRTVKPEPVRPKFKPPGVDGETSRGA